MRLRVYRNGRDFALSRDGVLWEGSEGQIRGDGYSRGDGWRELVVLDPDADAQRLAVAMGDYVEVAEALLRQLVAGTEGER